MTTSHATSGVLDSIDGALRDFDTSTDAMRWRPEGERAADPRQAPPRSPWIDLSGTTVVLDRPPYPFPLPDVRLPLPLLSSHSFTGSISGPLYPTAALSEFGRTMADTFRGLVDWASQMLHDLHLFLFRSRHRRCWTCHPERKPKPLAVNGHEYQRRLRARRRRRS